MRTAMLLAVALSAVLGVLLALREPPLVVRAYGHATHARTDTGLLHGYERENYR